MSFCKKLGTLLLLLKFKLCYGMMDTQLVGQNFIYGVIQFADVKKRKGGIIKILLSFAKKFLLINSSCWCFWFRAKFSNWVDACLRCAVPILEFYSLKNSCRMWLTPHQRINSASNPGPYRKIWKRNDEVYIKFRPCKKLITVLALLKILETHPWSKRHWKYS